MNNLYLREGHHYFFSELQSAFNLSEEGTRSRINLLKRHNILKTVKKERAEYTELSDQDIIVQDIPADSKEFCFQFNFVGVLLLNNFVLKCYPKYFDVKDSDKIFGHLKTVLKVIKKYNENNQELSLYTENDGKKIFNRLTLSLHILNDYYENGLYSNQEEKIVQNGEGEILWDKTINETFALLKNNTPYYLDYFTSDNTQNDFDFIRRLHAAIITKCSHDLNKEELLSLFDLESAELTQETLSDFGEPDYIKYRLENEIKNQFVTKKQNLLKTLYTYISEETKELGDAPFSLYGSTSFHMVWEKVCAQIFESIYSKQKISRYIEKPEWILEGKSFDYDGEMIPDIISLRKQDGNDALYILDGKYYLIQKSKTSDRKNKVSGIPGIQDVIKQYIYNAALRNFINEKKIGSVANAFLVPALQSEVLESQKTGTPLNPNLAQVPFWTVQSATFKELPTVQVIKLNPNELWENYLKNQKCSEEIWQSIKTSPTKHYLYHNKNDTSILSPNDSRTHILVGFLRQDYFDFIKTREKCNDFTFYFYATDKNLRYPMHPYIDFCTEFIGYTENHTEFVCGKLELLQNTRCKIDEITAENLQTELAQIDFIKKTSKAVTYHKMKVRDFSVCTRPRNIIQDFSALENLIQQNGLNQVLYEFSPKVIDL